MSISQFIRDNTSDGRNIARVLIDVMEGRLNGTRISHRLSAARLLTIYGHDDAPDFIDDNTPDKAETGSGRKIWLEIDSGLKTLIRARTDDGRVICMFLIDVMEGRIKGIHVGHRLSAAKELLNRAFGKRLSRDLPKPPKSSAPKRSTSRTRRKHAMTPEAAAFEARVAERIAANKPAQYSDTGHVPYPDMEAAQSESTHQEAPEASSNFDPEVYIAASRCIDPNFDPMLAASDDNYFWNYDGCEDVSCPYHGDPEDPDFDPNAHHY